MRLRLFAVFAVAMIAGEPMGCVRAGDGRVDVGASIKRGVTSGGAFVCPAAALAPPVAALVTRDEGARAEVARASAVVALVCATITAAIRAMGAEVAPEGGGEGEGGSSDAGVTPAPDAAP